MDDIVTDAVPTDMVTPESIITPENTETLPAPSETEIIEITEETTASPALLQPIGEGSPTPTFNTVYTENFEIEPLSNWSLGEGWTRAQTETGFALQSTQLLQRALFNPLVSDTEISFQVRWDAGRVHLHTHSSGLNEYQFSLSSDLQAILYRNGVIVATALTPEFVSVQWQTITYRKIGSTIEILLNNAPLLQYFDAEPLTSGQIALSAEGMTRAQWDEMTIKSGEVVETVEVLATEVPLMVISEMTAEATVEGIESASIAEPPLFEASSFSQLSSQATWSHTFDFTEDDGGFRVIAGRKGQYVAGVGWRTNLDWDGTNSDRYLHIERLFDTSTITSMAVEYDFQPVNTVGHFMFVGTQTGYPYDTLLTGQPTTGINTDSLDDIAVTTNLITIFTRVGSVAGVIQDPMGEVTVTKLTLTGLGQNPFEPKWTYTFDFNEGEQGWQLCFPDGFDWNNFDSYSGYYGNGVWNADNSGDGVALCLTRSMPSTYIETVEIEFSATLGSDGYNDGYENRVLGFPRQTGGGYEGVVNIADFAGQNRIEEQSVNESLSTLSIFARVSIASPIAGTFQLKRVKVTGRGVNPFESNVRYVSCLLTKKLLIRKQPSLLRYLPDGSDNLLEQFEGGEEIILNSLNESDLPSDVEITGSGDDINRRTVSFYEIKYGTGVAYVAKLAIFNNAGYPEITEQYVFPDRESAGCETPPPPPQIKPDDPNRRMYYQRYDGVIFWILYSELSENQFTDQFDIVDAQVQADAIVPSANFYGELPQVSQGFDATQTNGINVNGLDRRDHRYLYARTVISNMPIFTDQDTLGSYGRTDLYATGFRYTRRWGDSIGNVGNGQLWNNSDKCNIQEYNSFNTLTYYPTYTTAFSDPYIALGWLKKFMLCSKNNPDSNEVKPAYEAMIPYIQLAIEDEIRNLPNPLGFSNATRGTGQVKGANTCYFDPESPLGCSESTTANVQAFCQTPDANCRDATNGYWDSYKNGVPASTSVANWLTSTGNIVDIYNLYDNPDPNYLYPANAVRTQLVYRTRVGYEYFVTVGQYDDGNTPRYMLMGLGIGKVEGDTEQQAFSRHWSRLNYGGSFLPQTFRPDGCVAGLSHVLRVEGNIKTWVTLVYQASGDTDENNWFCAKG